MLGSNRPPPASPTARDLMREWRVALRPDLSVGAAAGLLDGAGADAAPVVDSSGRCVGVFTAGDYRRELALGVVKRCLQDTRPDATIKAACRSLDKVLREFQHQCDAMKVLLERLPTQPHQ